MPYHGVTLSCIATLSVLLLIRNAYSANASINIRIANPNPGNWDLALNANSYSDDLAAYLTVSVYNPDARLFLDDGVNAPTVAMTEEDWYCIGSIIALTVL